MNRQGFWTDVSTFAFASSLPVPDVRQSTTGEIRKRVCGAKPSGGVPRSGSAQFLCAVIHLKVVGDFVDAFHFPRELCRAQPLQLADYCPVEIDLSVLGPHMDRSPAQRLVSPEPHFYGDIDCRVVS